jgi:pimeloyl-ACP methyl ester carboxylesterase
MKAARSEVSDFFSVYEYGPTTAKKVYLFGGWRSRAVLFRPLVTGLVKQGYACVLFVPKRRLIAIGTPYSEIVKASHLVVDEILHRITIDKVIGVRQFVSFGISFGTLFAMELAKRSWDVRRLVLMSPFGDFAGHVELWPRHWYFGRVLASQPGGRQAAGAVLNQIGVAQGIDLLKGKQVLVCYSKKDKVIHSDLTEAMVRLLNTNGISADAVIAPGGHFRGIVHHILFKKDYEKFLITK